MRVEDIRLPQLSADAPEDVVRLVQALYDQWRDTNQRLWALETTLGIAPRKAATWAGTATTFLTTPSSANLAALLTDETGTGAAVFANTPTLVSPILGTPTSGTLTNATGLPVGTGISGLGANVATFLATPSSANLATALTDETGTGVAVFGTAPTINQANLVGTTTNNNAAAGSVGEVISSTVGAGAAVALTTATPANITSISLTAGDWDVWFEAYFTVAATTTVTLLLASISQTSATINQVVGSFGTLYYPASVLGAAESSVTAGPARLSLAGTTTIYAVAYAVFGVSTCAGYGILRARRIR